MMIPPAARLRLFAITVAVAFLCGSCGVFQEPKPKPAETGPGLVLVGSIEQVNPEQNYVLIRCDRPPDLAPGTELIGLDATGSRSKLVTTPERKGYYITADIKEGSPRITNLVLHQKGPLSPSGTASLTSAPPAEESSEKPSSLLPLPATFPGGTPSGSPTSATTIPLEPPLPKR